MNVTIELVAQFAAYGRKPGNEAWGVLHIGMDDGNLDNGSCSYMLERASEEGDREACELATILCSLTTTQRRKLRVLTNRAINQGKANG